MLPTSPDITPTYIYNPLKEDFTTKFAKDSNPPEPYTIRSKEIIQLPRYLANHIGNQLVRKIAIEAGSEISWDIREKEAHDKVFVNV